MWAFLSDGYCFFFFNDTAPTEIYTLSLHDALPISPPGNVVPDRVSGAPEPFASRPLLVRSEEHTSELQSPKDLVCRLLLEKKKTPQLSDGNDNSLLYYAYPVTP